MMERVGEVTVGVGVDKYDGKGRGEVTVGVGVDKYDGKGRGQ